MSEKETIRMEWRAHTPNLLQEIMNNPGTWILHTPLQIFSALLYEVAHRASELNDPQMNALMARLTLYSVADPQSPDFDKEVTEQLLSGAKHNMKTEHNMKKRISELKVGDLFEFNKDDLKQPLDGLTWELRKIGSVTSRARSTEKPTWEVTFLSSSEVNVIEEAKS